MQQVKPPFFKYQDHVYQRTEWMDGSLKPAHVGVYERDYSDLSRWGMTHSADETATLQYSYWDGKDWFPSSASAWVAFTQIIDCGSSYFQDLPWRGLTKPVMEKLA